MQIIKLSDIILILAFLLIAVVLLFSTKKLLGSGSILRITNDGGVSNYDLTTLKNGEKIFLENEYGYNIVLYENGFVKVIEADCRDGICVSHKPISSSDNSDIIICLPHKITIEFVDD